MCIFNMDKFKTSENIKEIIRDIDNRKFNEVLIKIELLFKNYPNLNISHWENEINNYEKSLKKN